MTLVHIRGLRYDYSFGYGRRSCPGGHYAVWKAKLIFAKLLMEYEFKWHEVGLKRRTTFTIEASLRRICNKLFW